MALTSAQKTSLETSLNNLVTEYQLVTASPGPNYTKGNQTFAKFDYMRGLREEIESLRQQLAASGDEGNYEVITTMY